MRKIKNNLFRHVISIILAVGLLFSLSAAFNPAPLTASAAVAAERIEIISLPKKTIYLSGEIISLDGAELKVYYIDGSSETYTLGKEYATWRPDEYSINGSPLNYDQKYGYDEDEDAYLFTGDFKLNIYYMECETSITVTFVENPAERIELTKYIEYGSIITVFTQDSQYDMRIISKVLMVGDAGINSGYILTDMGIFWFTERYKGSPSNLSFYSFSMINLTFEMLIAPKFSGPAAMSLQTGYAACSTGTYTITGFPSPAVTKISGDAKITWNSTTKRLDIASGLAAGTYPVILKASNGILPDATITFTLTVISQYTISVMAGTGGTVAASAERLAAGEIVTFTVNAEPGCRLKNGMLYYSADGGITRYPLYMRVGASVYTGGGHDSDTVNQYTLTMPATDIIIYAEFVSDRLTAANAAETALSVFGVSYRSDSDPAGAGLRFGSRVLREINIDSTDYTLRSCGTLLIRNDYLLANPKTGGSWQAWASAHAGGLWRNVSATQLLDRCTEYVDFAAKITDFTA